MHAFARLVAVVVVLCVALTAAKARADGGTEAGTGAGAGATLSLDEPTTGLHVDVFGACRVRPKSDAGAACPDHLERFAGKSNAFAAVLGPEDEAIYTVALFVDRTLGVGEPRAQRVTATHGKVTNDPQTVVTYGGQRFVRSRIRTRDGMQGLCFVTADDSPDVAAIVFTTENLAPSELEPIAESAMSTLRRPKNAIAPAADAPMSCGSQAIISLVLFFVIGLPVFGLVFRAIRIARRFSGSTETIDEPIRSPGRRGPQLAGESCVQCKKSIVVSADATECPVCGQPVHKDCVGRHKTAKHA